jgi:hypothetical protein
MPPSFGHTTSLWAGKSDLLTARQDLTAILDHLSVKNSQILFSQLFCQKPLA